MSGESEKGHMRHYAAFYPERESDPRDDRTGWERPRKADLCACGRHVVVAGQCQWCGQGIVMPLVEEP